MPSRTILMFLAAAVAAVVAAMAAFDPFGANVGGHVLQPGDAKVVAQGQSIYQTHCAACHGAKLEGQPNWRERDDKGLLPAPPHDASGHTWHHPDEVLVRITKLGVAKAANLKDYASAMPIYEGVLSDKEIVAVLSWIKAQWPAQIREKHDQMNAQAQSAAKP